MDPVKLAEHLNKVRAAELHDQLRQCLVEPRGKLSPTAFRALERRLMLQLDNKLNKADADSIALAKNHKSSAHPATIPKTYSKVKPVSRR